MNHKSTATALFILRMSMFCLMIAWAIFKLAQPERNIGLYERFYGIDLGLTLVYVLGAIQIAFLLAYLVGAFKFWTIGGVMLMNLASLVVSFPRLLNPLEPGNMLFFAAIPVLGASVAHFILRDQDRFMTIRRGAP